MVTESPVPPGRRRVVGAAAYREVERDIRARLLEVMGDMPISDFTKAVKLNRESVRRAIRGGTIRTELVLRVCARFNVSADWLLFGIGSKQGAAIPLLLELKRPANEPARPACPAEAAEDAPVEQ